MTQFKWVVGGGGHCRGNCTPTHNQGQSEVKRSRQNFETGQAVKIGIGGSLRTVKVSPGHRWAWLMLNSQGSRPDFWCGQGVKHENLLDQNLDLASSPGPLKGGETAWYTLSAHAPFP